MKVNTRAFRHRFNAARIFILLLLTLDVGNPAGAQDLTLDLTQLSRADDFSQNTIHCIFQDSYGLMWFGTQDGLNKYDGYRVEVFKHKRNDPTSLSANHVTAISEDENGNLWIGTRTGGLNKYDRAKDTFYRFQHRDSDPRSLNSNQINFVFRDSESNTWIGTPLGLTVLRKGARDFQRISLDRSAGDTDNEDVRAIFQDRQKNIWIGTNEGLKLLKNNTTKILHYQDEATKTQDNTINALAGDDQGNIWIGWAGGLKMFDQRSATFSSYLIEPDKNSVGGLNPVFCLAKAGNNRFWFGSNTTLQLFDVAQRKIIHVNERTDGDTSMPNDGIYSLFQDKAGALWIGTTSQGILKYDRNLTTFQSYKSSLTNIPSARNIVRAMAEDNLGNLYIGTDGGFEYFDRQHFTYKKYSHQQGNPNSLSSNYTTTIIHSRKSGQVWIGTYSNGLDVFDPGSGTFRHFTKGPGPNTVGSNSIDILLEDKLGRIWIGTDGGGVNRYDPATGIFTKYLNDKKNAASLCDNTVLALYEDKKGNIWTGGYSKGISILDQTKNTFSQLNTSNSALTSDIVGCFYEDSKGYMWIGTQGGGLNRYDPRTKSITSFTEENGLINNSVNYISEDAYGFLWIGTNQGIVSFDTGKGIFRHFGKSNNLNATEFNLNAGVKLSTGEIAMGNINGFNIIDPSGLTYNNNKPNIVFTGLQLFNKPVNVKTMDGPLKQTLLTSKEIQLEYSHSVFTISFAALNYTSPENNQYAYILEGFDKDWNHTGNVHNASYTNLNPGTYTLRVRASNNDGLWSDKEASLVIHIKAPYWMTWWFKSAVILLISAAAYLFYYYKMKFERTQKRRLEMLVRRRTIEIRDQASNLQKLNHELLKNTTSLEELNNQLQEQKEQEHIARLTAESAQKQADAANSAKSTFLATMSHELRTPINGVMGMASLLRETSLNKEQQEYAEAILTSGESLLSVINDVLDFSKIESGNIELDAHPFELRKCIEDVLVLFRPKIVESGIRLHYRIDSKIPSTIVADSLRLKQVLINLTGNAVKFTHRGEVLMNVSAGEALAGNLKLQFEIRDTGIGISKEQQNNLFKAFNQLDSSVTRKYGGSGLGLVICERLVRLMGGEIEVESEIGTGSTFRFEIDCRKYEAPKVNGNDLIYKENGQKPQLNQNRRTALPEDFASHHPYNILVAEDILVNQKLIVWILNKLGYQPDLAGNGLEVLEMMKVNAYDLILMDLQMPEMDGLEATRIIRQTYGARPLIVALTANAMSEDRQNCLAAGMNDYMSKPINLEVLTKCLTNLYGVRVGAE